VSSSPRRPNILWICTDQQRYDTLGAQGNAHVSTPRLDSLWRSGTAFTHAYCQSPICTPSRASFLTGMYPSAIPANQNGNPAFPAAAAERLVPRRLRDAGYDCGLVGKLHLASAAGGKEPRVDDGYRFVRYSTSPHGRLPGQDYAAWLRQRGVDADAVMARVPHTAVDRHVANGVVWERVCPPTADDDNIPAELHQTRWCTEMALEFIDQRRSCDTPWLLSINPFDPHPPFDPPWEYYRRFDPEALPDPPFKEADLVTLPARAGVEFQTMPRHPAEYCTRSLRAAYLAMLELADAQIGRVLDALDESGQRDNTLVVLTSDHGDMQGDHGLVRKGCRFYEGLVRVPLIWRWPGHVRAGLRSDALVELTDIVPTLLDAVGLAPGRLVTGRSLLPLLTGGEQEQPHREFVRAEFYDAQGLGGADRRMSVATMFRDARWKLVVYHSHGVGELYDLDDDPDEFVNLWDVPSLAATKLRLMEASFASTVMDGDLGPPLLEDLRS
jgi:arylsulfatase A-like enzyme